MNARKRRQVGLWSFLAVILVLFAWDAVMQFVFGLKSTVSWSVWDVSTRAPILVALPCFAVGMVFGHLYWSGYADAQAEKKKMVALLRRAAFVMNPPVGPETSLREDILRLLSDLEGDEDV